MGRWTQYDEDSTRLPEGFERIGYDADTGRYTFRDRAGTIYESAPYAEYGTLTPVTRPSAQRSSAPSPPPKSYIGRSASMHTTRSSTAHSTISSRARSPSSFEFNEKGSGMKSRSPTTFHDILPSSGIATSPTNSDSSPPSTSPHSRFIEAARKTALPKMQGVVTQLRRSVTSTRRPGRRGEREKEGDDGAGLLRSQSTMSRSTMGSMRSGESFGSEKKGF